METLRIHGQYETEKVSQDSALHCAEETLTRQEFKEECDINTIIDRFGIGENPIEMQKWITDVDIANAPDNYMDVMNQLNEARDQFMSLPARVRSRFNNSPHEFVQFVSDPSNVDEMVHLGLAEMRPIPESPITPKPPENGGAQSSS